MAAATPTPPPMLSRKLLLGTTSVQGGVTKLDLLANIPIPGQQIRALFELTQRLPGAGVVAGGFALRLWLAAAPDAADQLKLPDAHDIDVWMTPEEFRQVTSQRLAGMRTASKNGYGMADDRVSARKVWHGNGAMVDFMECGKYSVADTIDMFDLDICTVRARITCDSGLLTAHLMCPETAAAHIATRSMDVPPTGRPWGKRIVRRAAKYSDLGFRAHQRLASVLFKEAFKHLSICDATGAPADAKFEVSGYTRQITSVTPQPKQQ